MPNRRIFCEVIEGICVEGRCLYALKKIIEGNRTCESCMVRELEDIKSARVRKEKEKIELYPRKERRKAKGAKALVGSKPLGETGPVLKKRRNRKVEWAKRKINKQTPSVQDDINMTKVSNVTKASNVTKVSHATFDIRSLSDFLGRSVRRTQELAKEGKIPGHKVGAYWVFDKGEIDRWLSESKDHTGEESQVTDKPPQDEFKG